jgi:lysozyme
MLQIRAVLVFIIIGALSFTAGFCFSRFNKQVKKKPVVYTHSSSDKIWGIDISHHQGNIDWDGVREELPYFIFIKATEGSTFTDPRFSHNVKEATKRGLRVGAYHFFSYHSSGKKQAEHFLKTVYRTGVNMPIVLDVEYQKHMKSSSWIKREIREFVNVVKERTGKLPIIYCECLYYNKYIKNVISEKFPTWIANFKKRPPCRYDIHQITNRRRVKGFKGLIDYNEFNGTHEQFVDFYNRLSIDA